MMTQRTRFAKRRGQITVVVVASLMTIFGMLALAIDAGSLFRTRQYLQYACEAAALAGAMELPNADNARAQAQRCAAGMGLSLNTADVSFPDANTIRVLHNRSVRFSVAGVLGFRNPKVLGAVAAVRVGAAKSLAGGAFPVGVPDELVNSITPGTIVKIWDNDKITDDSGNLLFGGNRGWLNLNFIFSQVDPNSRTIDKNESNAALKSWVKGGSSSPIYAGSIGGIDGDFINGDNGTRSSTIKETADRIGSVVPLVVYDDVYTRSWMQSNFLTPDIGWAGGLWDSYYHVVGFAAFEIVEVQAEGSQKWIRGRFVQRIMGNSIGGALTGSAALRSTAMIE